MKKIVMILAIIFIYNTETNSNQQNSIPDLSIVHNQGQHSVLKSLMFDKSFEEQNVSKSI